MDEVQTLPKTIGNVSSMQRLICENLRKNYSVTSLPAHVRELLWDTFPHKQDFENMLSGRGNKIFRIEVQKIMNSIKEFVLNMEEEQSLDIRASRIARKRIHEVCDDLKLFHHSVNREGKRILIISKPKDWRWNHTSASNPYPKPIPKNPFREKFCSLCDASNKDVQLLSNCFIRGLFCEKCIEDDDELDAHKWEDIY